MMTERRSVPWQHLDPGIRRVVQALNDHGFTTTDSGDGVSKPKVGRVYDFPHVFMVVDPVDMAHEAQRLHGLLPTIRCLGWVVEASYRPADGVGALALLNPAEEAA